MWIRTSVAMYSPKRAIPVTVTGISTLCGGYNLSFAAILWESGLVKRNITIRRLLAILMIAGLVLAPVSQPVMASTSSDAPMQAMADEMSPSDMPCCPSKAPMPVDCDKCVFMAACMSKCFTGMTASVFHPYLIASDRIAIQRNDSAPDGLGHPPPEHPPRTLV